MRKTLLKFMAPRKKRGKLEAANQQIVKYADDLNKTISDLKAANRELQEAYLERNRFVPRTSPSGSPLKPTMTAGKPQNTAFSSL